MAGKSRLDNSKTYRRLFSQNKRTVSHLTGQNLELEDFGPGMKSRRTKFTRIKSSDKFNPELNDVVGDTLKETQNLRLNLLRQRLSGITFD